MPDDELATNDEPTTDAPAPAEIDDERAAYYAPDPEPEPVASDDERAAYYAPDGEPDAAADDDDEVSTELTKAELVAEAEARGLATSGTKADLVARIEEHDAAEPDEGEGVTDA